MPMSPRLLRPIASRSLVDADATAYLTAVQAADGQALEPAVRNAITAFVIGCKQDGIWSAIKASCILMGARTLSGALTPLVGAAPTNNNFVSGDYNRRTGLTGNGTTKWLRSGRGNADDPQDSKHMAAFMETVATSGLSCYVAGDDFNAGSSWLARDTVAVNGAARNVASPTASSGNFYGLNRSNSTQITARVNGATQTISQNSAAPRSGSVNAPLGVFAMGLAGSTNGAYFASAAISYYSIGESLSLPLLESRVAALNAAIKAAIP